MSLEHKGGKEGGEAAGDVDANESHHSVYVSCQDAGQDGLLRGAGSERPLWIKGLEKNVPHRGRNNPLILRLGYFGYKVEMQTTNLYTKQ